MPRATVAASLGVDPDFLAGADPLGRLRLFAPDPVDPGSSISHWDAVASPDLLMEPAIGGNVEIGDLDLTLDQLRDIGWSPGSSNVVVHFGDAQGEGFFAPDPLGQNRRDALLHVASIWGGLLNSGVTIHVDASFDELDCDSESAVLAQAGPQFIFESFAGADVPSTWYPGALAEALSGQNLSLEDDVDPEAGDITATFNTRIDEGCIGGGTFSYNLSGNAPARQVSFVNVALHELGHGLGFVSLVNESTGANPFGPPRHLQRLHARHHERPPLEPDDQRRARRLGDEHRAPGVGRRQRARGGAQLPVGEPDSLRRLAEQRRRRLRGRDRAVRALRSRSRPSRATWCRLPTGPTRRATAASRSSTPPP